MCEFYQPRNKETPVSIEFPCVSFFGKEDGEEGSEVIQTQTEYYGTHLSFDEVVERLSGLGFINRTGDGERMVRSLDLVSGLPLYPGRHEFYAGITDEWGFRSKGVSRYGIHLHLYFNDWDLYFDECPYLEDCCNECGYDHNKGWNYEDDIIEALSLDCDC